MKHILARAQREILAQFSWSKLLVAFDFDGTLAPIVPEPDRARISALTSRLLSSVATAYPTAVISGRSRDDVAARVGGVPLVAVVGNHGAEESDQRPPVTQCVRAWVEVLSERVSAVPGVAAVTVNMTSPMFVWVVGDWVGSLMPLRRGGGAELIGPGGRPTGTARWRPSR